MASTNFLVFDEGKQNMMSDGDYSANTQRARGVTPGIAYPNLHNKLYYQVSVMAKAIADFMVAQGANASDEDVEQLTADISTAFTNFVDNKTKDVYLPLSGGTMKGNINANGYNITATKFIGNLQGKADSATKATQDKNGNDITTTYLSRDQSTQNDLNTLTTEGIYRFSGALANAWTGVAWGTLLTFNNKYNQNSGSSYITQMAFPTQENYVYVRRKINTQNWESWQMLAYTNSPAFTGTPTAPTQAASDNSTKLATTAFVKSLFTASKNTNGWWKDASTGMIWQWGYVEALATSNDVTITFPITFNTVLNAGYTIISDTKQDADGFQQNSLLSLNNNGMTVFSFWLGIKGYYWQAIGY